MKAFVSFVSFLRNSNLLIAVNTPVSFFHAIPHLPRRIEGTNPNALSLGSQPTSRYSTTKPRGSNTLHKQLLRSASQVNCRSLDGRACEPLCRRCRIREDTKWQKVATPASGSGVRRPARATAVSNEISLWKHTPRTSQLLSHLGL